MKYLIGADLGTTAAKVIVFTEDGRIASRASSAYGITYRSGGYAEQRPASWWRAFRKCTRSAAGEIGRRRKEIPGMSFSTQGAVLIPADKECRVLSPAISWLDTRAQQEAKHLLSLRDEEFFQRRCGHKMSPVAPSAKILWIRKHTPHVFSRTEKFLFVSDWILHRLTGNLVMDPSSAAMTWMNNLEAYDWDDSILDLIEITRERLSPLSTSGSPVGRITPSAAQALSLSPEILVVNGAHDQYAAALGAGAIDEHDMILSCGTAWVIIVVSRNLRFHRKSLFIPGAHAIRGLWGNMFASGNGGAVWDWVLKEFVGKKRIDFSRLEGEICAVPPGADGLIFLPHFYNGAIPFGIPDARGVISGLTLSHTRDHILRAVMEGIAMDFRVAAETLPELGMIPKKIKMYGGAAKSAIWPEIVSAVLDLPIELMDDAEAACRGAAMLAGMGSGVFRDHRDAVQRMGAPVRAIEPRRSWVNEYDRIYERYMGVFQKNKP